jgi:hypothetical protein
MVGEVRAPWIKFFGALLCGGQIDIGNANELDCRGAGLDRARVHREHIRANANYSKANHWR